MTSKHLAGFSLSVMAAGFLVTLFLPETTFMFLLRGGFEAGLVGGIADWFAVTALFRHPFGLPIPHTSLLLKNRDKIIRTLIATMENELLNKRSIEGKLRNINILKSVFTVSAKLLRKRSVRLGILSLLTETVRRLPLEKSLPFLQNSLSGMIRSADLKAAAQKLLTGTVHAGYDQKLFDAALSGGLDWVQRPDTRALLGKLAVEKLSEVKVGGFMGFAFQAFAGFMDEEKLGFILQDMLASAIRGLSDKANPSRERIIRGLLGQLYQLADNAERLQLIKDWAVEGVQDRNGTVFLNARLEEVRDLILDKLEEERLNGARIIFTAYRSIIRFINKESEQMERMESRLIEYAVGLVESNHYRIGQLVKENLDRMDDAALVEMLEEKLGRDLQWIRVNGAICGFVVGVLLSLIQL